MKKYVLLFSVLGFILNSFGQIQNSPGGILGSPSNLQFPSKTVQKRNAINPSTCGTDTSEFTNLSSTGYPLIAMGNGQQIGQFFGTPQEITVKGFRFFAYTPWDTMVKNTYRNVYAKIYKAGPDSLPRGAALDSVLIKIDTITSGLTFARLAKDAVFNKPLTIDFAYVLTVECDETTNIPAIVTNSWSNADGENRNLSAIQLNNRWFRGTSLSVGGVTFDAHFIMFPFVSYKFGTDFTIKDDCYLLIDSFNFENNYQNTVAGSVFYNNYMYYASAGFDALCHSWTYDGNIQQIERIHGKFKPGSKKNVSVKLNSFVVPFSLNLDFCLDSSERTLYYKPNTAAINGTTDGCIGQNLTLNITPNKDVTHLWYHKETDTTTFNTGNSYTLNNLQNNDTFFIKSKNGPCFARTYTALITANQTPSTLNITNDSVCSDASAILKASTDAGNILWYQTATGGTPVLTATEFVTSKLTADTTYYAEANNKGCLLPSGRKAVTAFVNADFAPPKPTGASDTQVCYTGANSNLTLKAFTTSSASVRWFDVASGGSPISQSTDFVYNITGRGSQTFYVETWDGRCGSGRLPVKVMVNAVPTTFAKVGAEICIGDSADIAASASWGSINWYANKSSQSPFANGKFIRSGGHTTAKSYAFFKTIEGECENSEFDSVEIIVNIPPTATVVSASDVCKGANARIELNVNQGNINWFFDNTASNSIATGNILNLGELFNTTTRYYETELNGCKSSRNAITINALDMPAAGFSFVVEFPKKLTCTPLNTNNTTLVWNFGDGNSSTDNIGVNTYENEGDYTVKLVVTSTLSGCQDSVSSKVTINHNAIEKNAINFHVYPNPVHAGGNLYTDRLFETATWYDLSGRILATQQETSANSKAILIPQNAQEGLYLLELRTKEFTQRIKIQILR